MVWNAVATSEGIAAWFMPNTFEPVLGHTFVLHAGPFGDSPCVVTELNSPHRLAFNWDKDWRIVFELKALDDKATEFTLVHEGFDADKTTRFGQPHTAIRDVMDGGWEKKVSIDLPVFIGG